MISTNDPYELEVTLKAEKLINNSSILLMTIIVATLTFIGGLYSGFIAHEKYVKFNTPIVDSACIVEEVHDSLTLDYHCIQRLLERHKVKFSYIVLGQIHNESNNLKYWPRIKDNNLLGMKVAAQRYCFATNSWDYGNFAKFKDIEDCIRDYKAWQVQNAYFIQNESDYYALLDKVYDFEDEGYSDRIKNSSRTVYRLLKNK